MSLNESRGPKVREQWPVEFDLEGVPRETKVRTQKLQEETMPKSLSPNSFAGSATIDIGRPPRESYNPRDPKNQYPKMLYHQTKKDPNWLREHRRITLYNSLHPEKPELLPHVPYAFVVVNSPEEEKAFLGQGFGLRAPAQPQEKDEWDGMENEVLCSRGCGKKPHRGSCSAVTDGVTI